jgi:hypothetical protein
MSIECQTNQNISFLIEISTFTRGIAPASVQCARFHFLPDKDQRLNSNVANSSGVIACKINTCFALNTKI